VDLEVFYLGHVEKSLYNTITTLHHSCRSLIQDIRGRMHNTVVS